MRIFAGSPAHEFIIRNNLFGSVLDLIGNTPLLELSRISHLYEAKVFAKAEFLNPSGSIKDRMVHYAVESAEREDLLGNGDTIVEASSGNTGISIAMIAAYKGYKAVIVVPETTSSVKVKMMERYGAEVIYTPSEEGIDATIRRAKKEAEERCAFLLDQFRNPDNVRAHHATGEEILRQAGHVDAFVAGIGTGGTLVGVAQVLKEANPETKIVAVEPALAPAYYNMYYGCSLPIGSGIPHRIEGIGETFVPEIVRDNTDIVDEVMLVGDEVAFEMMRMLAAVEGLLTGISSGANVHAAMEFAKNLDYDARIVTVLPDSGQRYPEV
ncbi:MAG: PLP-dependent cysteine synthase family protein [Candidatus Bathyarchaeota archaeon]|nr:PLP-dependent cysteine synthase family protein [Candidatus Bathyarchaeota archaeon]